MKAYRQTEGMAHALAAKPVVWKSALPGEQS